MVQSLQQGSTDWLGELNGAEKPESSPCFLVGATKGTQMMAIASRHPLQG
jgi:hypothetical protein